VPLAQIGEPGSNAEGGADGSEQRRRRARDKITDESIGDDQANDDEAYAHGVVLARQAAEVDAAGHLARVPSEHAPVFFDAPFGPLPGLAGPVIPADTALEVEGAIDAGGILVAESRNLRPAGDAKIVQPPLERRTDTGNELEVVARTFRRGEQRRLTTPFGHRIDFWRPGLWS